MTSDSTAHRFPASALLGLCELFGDTAPEVLGECASELRLVRLERGEILMTQGDPSDCMYAIVSGRVQLFVAVEGSDELVAELGSGATVGEVDLIDGRPRMTTVRAVRDTQLVRVSRLGFDKLVRGNADALNQVARILAGRMRALAHHERPTTQIRTIALLSVGEGPRSFQFGAALCEALGAFGPVLHLTEERYKKIYGVPFRFSSGIAARLSELEGSYRFIVLETEGEQSSFAAHCLRQADRVLLVGRAGSSPDLIEAEKVWLSANAPGSRALLELVLLHEESGRVFSGTAKWLAKREVFRRHHVRIGVSGDVSRLARILAGCAVGLALGGGGARGFAHIGVIRAIEEANIPIDTICGVSMGSIIAGQYAMGWDWKTMVRMNLKAMAQGGIQSDYTLPLVSLSSGRKFQQALHTFFGKTEIEDLWLAYFCTSCNLSTSELVIHRSGGLSSAISASNAIPAILPPILSKGHMLVDGGILNNQPGDVLKRICGGAVMVSSVSPKRELAMDESLTEMPSPWQILASRVNPFRTSIRVPGIPATMMRALMVASNRKSREVERDAEFYLRPPIDRFRLDDMGKVEEIAEVGYEYARDEIRTWKEENRLPGSPGRAADL
jgi:predicted acylesterase/phospholipase RssA/CRP-like cAMP-binding protein